MKSFGITFFILLLSIHISFASGSANIVFKSLDKRIVTINDDKYIFHWVTKEKILERTKQAFSQASIYDYVLNTIQYGQNKGNSHGLYFAMDPLISSGFGAFGASGDKWVLIAYKIPKGTRLLDSVSNLKLSLKEKRWFKKQGCPAKNLEAFGQYTNILNTDCAKAFNNFYKIKNISGIIYTWQQTQLPFCAPLNEYNPYTYEDKPKAIILKDMHAISPKNMFILDSSRKFTNSNLSEIKRILNTYTSLFANRYKINELSFPEEDSLTYEELKTRMINCH